MLPLFDKQPRSIGINLIIIHETNIWIIESLGSKCFAWVLDKLPHRLLCIINIWSMDNSIYQLIVAFSNYLFRLQLSLNFKGTATSKSVSSREPHGISTRLALTIPGPRSVSSSSPITKRSTALLGLLIGWFTGIDPITVHVHGLWQILGVAD